jgi:hypothetical protein
LKAIEAAILKATSEESTPWYEPSKAFTPHIYDGMAREAPRLHRFPHAPLGGAHICTGDHTAHHGINEFEAPATLQGLELQPDMAILPPSPGLPDEFPLGLDWPPDCLLIGYLRLGDGCADVELAEEPFHENLQMQLSHARDQRLACLSVRRDSERRVLLCQFMERASQFSG